MGAQHGGGTVLTWELDCRWGKEKRGMMTQQVEETFEAGDESTQREKSKKKKNKKETLEPEHKETTTRKQ